MHSQIDLDVFSGDRQTKHVRLTYGKDCPWYMIVDAANVTHGTKDGDEVGSGLSLTIIECDNESNSDPF